MDMTFYIGIFVGIYGAAVLLGYGSVSKKYEGYKWSKAYQKSQGMSVLILGICWILYAILLEFVALGFMANTIGLAVASLPALIHFLVMNSKYKKLAEEDDR